MDVDTFREGIFSLHTRRFGTVAELIVKKLVKLGRAQSLFHDLYDDQMKRRVEVKFSRVRTTHETPIDELNVLRCIKEATSEQRMVPFAIWDQATFDCNIQQIKRSEFDVLYYGLFFADCVVMFHIDSSEIDGRINYSDKQHKGNVGEGQFHVNQKTLQIHLDNYLYQELPYEQLIAILSN